MELEHRDFPLQLLNLRAAGGDGAPHTIEGYAAVFGGKPNSYGEVVARGAFVESLRQRTPKFLWQHFQHVPIAKVLDLAEDEHGLYGKWQLANTDDARKAYELIKEGLVEGLSIGFIARDVDWDEEGVRVLRRVDLYEVSAVTMPAQDAAQIVAVRADLPLHVLLKQAAEALGLATREAGALHARRSAEGRELTDRHNAALDELLGAVEAARGLAALRVGGVEAEAEYHPEAAALALRLAMNRRNFPPVLRESA